MPTVNIRSFFSLQGEIWICMQLMDLSIDRMYLLANANQYEITESFLKRLAYSVSYMAM